MKAEEYVIDSDCILRDWLKKRFSKRRVLSLKRNGGMTVGGIPVRADQRMLAGQVIRLEFTEDKERDFSPKDLGLKVVYEDEDVTVIHKGRGVTSMPTRRHLDDSILNGMKLIYPDRTFRVVTRLDKDTEGLVLLANNAVTHSRLKDVKKIYVAVVKGVLKEEITVNAPIARGERIKRYVGGDIECLSVMTPLWWGKTYSAVLMQPVTGRTHQLRVHSAYVGHPIVGDTLYGDGEGEYNSGQMLACVELNIVHPTTLKKVTVTLDGLREEYLAFAKRLDLQ